MNLRRDNHLMNQADARFDALSRKLQRAYQEKLMMLSEIQSLKCQLRIAPIPSVVDTSVNQLVPYNERPDKVALQSENQGEAWNRLVDANIRSGMMASMWCLRTHVVKRLASAFHRWRQNILVDTGSPRQSGIESALAVIKKYSSAPLPAASQCCQPIIVDVDGSEASLFIKKMMPSVIDDIDVKRKALLDDAHRIMMGNKLVPEIPSNHHTSFPADDFKVWGYNAVKNDSSTDIMDNSATSPLDRMKLILSLGDVTSSALSFPSSSSHAVTTSAAGIPFEYEAQRQMMRSYSHSRSPIRNRPSQQGSLAAVSQSHSQSQSPGGRMRRLQYKGPRYLTATVASRHNVSPKRSRSNRTPPRYCYADSIPYQTQQQQLQEQQLQEQQQQQQLQQYSSMQHTSNRNSPPSASRWSNDQDSSNVSSSLGRMSKKARSPSRMKNTGSHYSGHSSGAVTRPQSSYHPPIGVIDFTNKENIRFEAKQPPVPGYLQQTLASKGQRRQQRQGLGAKNAQSNVTKSSSANGPIVNKVSRSTSSKVSPPEHAERSKITAEAHSEAERGWADERMAALGSGAQAMRLRSDKPPGGPVSESIPIKAGAGQPTQTRPEDTRSGGHGGDSRSSNTRPQQTVEPNTAWFGLNISNGDFGPQKQQLNIRGPRGVELPLHLHSSNSSCAPQDDETVSDITDQVDPYPRRHASSVATAEDPHFRGSSLDPSGPPGPVSLDRETRRAWDGVSCDGSLVHKPCLG